MPAEGQSSNVPREPIYGEQKQIDEQVESAPLPDQPEATAIQPTEVPETDAQVEPGQAVPPFGRNLISVLPPEASAPSETFTVPMKPEQTVALAILALPGIGSMARSLGAQIMGKYTGPGYVGEETPPAPVATEYDEVGLLPPEEVPNA